MSFLQRFQSSLESLYLLPQGAKYVIAYSGGVDSHVLLHCCYKLKIPLRAVHIHHGLQSVADDWVPHCQHVCDDLNIPLDLVYVDATKKSRQSPEESARIARYAALQKNLQQGDCLLTAQHLDDQAETFLLQLFRSAGSAGLAAMPVSKRIGDNLHLRPLLFSSRHEIEAYARDAELVWIEDPSNQDEKFDRNFIRKNVTPLLSERWPEAVKQLVTVSEMQSSNLQVLEDMAAIDLAHVLVLPEQVQSLMPVWLHPVWPRDGQQLNESRSYGVVSVLSISLLKKLSTVRLLNVLRYWVKQSTEGSNVATLDEKLSPTRNLLQEIEKTIIHSQQDANPVIAFSGFEYRKYQDNLFLLKPNKYISASLSGQAKSNQQDLTWNPSQEITLPTLNCKISAVNGVSRGLNKTLFNEKLKLSFRKGGETFHPAGREHSQSLKKLFQEANIPPWERDGIPLLYWQDELIAVVGFWISKHHVAPEGDDGWLVEIESCNDMPQ